MFMLKIKYYLSTFNYFNIDFYRLRNGIWMTNAYIGICGKILHDRVILFS